MALLNLIRNFDEKYPKPAEFQSKTVAYGTAGFRMKAVHLDWIMYRMGFLACFRSICKDLKFIGCMITASHNPEEDNGCKLIDPFGDMLEEKWEHYATEIVNSNDLKQTLINLCENEFKDFVSKFDAIDSSSKLNRPNIAVAHDTRSSCARLLDAFKAGVEALNGVLVNYGLLTTPQLHYMIRCSNTNFKYGEANEEGYYNKLSNAFCRVWSQIEFKPNNKYETELFIDGANGVGASKIRLLAQLISSAFGGSNENRLNFYLFNEGHEQNDILNHLCGADHVKVQQKPPVNLPGGDSNNNNSKIRKYCSFDGDADRIVYYYLANNVFHLLDGDKISTLVATQLKELVETSSLSDKINLGIVQTAYANGSSTNFIQDVMKVKVSCVPTGVKHLHHEAQHYDIGVYFEANGHGTILFSEKAEELIENRYSELIDNKALEAGGLSELFKRDKSLKSLYILKHLKDCINQTVGDAISDLLVVELILALRQMSVTEWDTLYTDLPSRQLKVTIKDRTIIKTYDAERRVSEPAELQSKLDELINKSGFKNARSFVRPSGTEDVVRVYAEADTQVNTDDLAKQVSQLVYDLAGGVGKRP